MEKARKVASLQEELHKARFSAIERWMGELTMPVEPWLPIVDVLVVLRIDLGARKWYFESRWAVLAVFRLYTIYIRISAIDY